MHVQKTEGGGGGGGGGGGVLGAQFCACQIRGVVYKGRIL